MRQDSFLSQAPQQLHCRRVHRFVLFLYLLGNKSPFKCQVIYVTKGSGYIVTVTKCPHCDIIYAAIPRSYKYRGAKPISLFQSTVKGSRRNDLK